MEDERILQVLRDMAIQRAIGELEAAQYTYYSGTKEKTEEMEILKDIIKELKDNFG